MTSWVVSMLAAGACSAGLVLLNKELPRFVVGLSPALVVAIFMLFGGAIVLACCLLSAQAGLSNGIVWPGAQTLLWLAGVGALLAVLEMFFVHGGRQNMPVTEALIVYNVTSLAVVAMVSIVVFGEELTWQRVLGVGLGIGSMVLLLMPTKA